MPFIDPESMSRIHREPRQRSAAVIAWTCVAVILAAVCCGPIAYYWLEYIRP